MKLNRMLSVFTLVAALVTASVSFAGNAPQTTSKFEGPKANTGTAMFSVENGKRILRVSADFKVPDTPAPTWRVIDSKGNIYTLDAFKVKAGSGEKREVMVPAYVRDIVKVQVYCAWAEVILGQAGFDSPVS
ncbi:MAG: hypothetical protein LAO55_11520 [Acidobacteriia bacterium]|nr:hypothetical protein [Terriglobia bacterium]